MKLKKVLLIGLFVFLGIGAAWVITGVSQTTPPASQTAPVETKEKAKTPPPADAQKATAPTSEAPGSVAVPATGEAPPPRKFSPSEGC